MVQDLRKIKLPPDHVYYDFYSSIYSKLQIQAQILRDERKRVFDKYRYSVHPHDQDGLTYTNIYPELEGVVIPTLRAQTVWVAGDDPSPKLLILYGDGPTKQSIMDKLGLIKIVTGADGFKEMHHELMVYDAKSRTEMIQLIKDAQSNEIPVHFMGVGLIDSDDISDLLERRILANYDKSKEDTYYLFRSEVDVAINSVMEKTRTTALDNGVNPNAILPFHFMFSKENISNILETIRQLAVHEEFAYERIKKALSMKNSLMRESRRPCPTPNGMKH